MLRLKERANDFCSLLCAFRLLEVVGKLESPNDQRQTPVHKKMGLNFSKNEVDIETDESVSNLPTQKLRALF
jgi:hypothetical protein